MIQLGKSLIKHTFNIMIRVRASHIKYANREIQIRREYKDYFEIIFLKQYSLFGFSQKDI